jgi:hypothetical protein
MIGSDTQGHFLPMMAPATILRRVGRVDFEERSASIFRFARELLKELRPCRLGNTFCQTMIVDHAVDVQVFNTDGPKGVDDLSTVLVGEVVTSPFGPFIHTSNHLAMSTPLFGAFLQSGMFALNLRQCLFFFAEETRVRNFFPVGEGCKGLESNVDTNGERIVLQPDRIAHDRKGDVPFPGRGAVNGTGLDRPFDWAVIDHLDRANLREAHTIIMGETEATLRIGDAVVATISFKTGIARFLSGLAASEKGFAGQIDTNRNILQDLGMYLAQRGTVFFQNRIRLLLLKTQERNAITLVGRVAHLQQMIIQDATLFKVRIKRSLLFLRRIDPVLIVFKHKIILRLNRVGVKKIPKCPIPSRHQKERPFIPGLKTRGFLARHCKNGYFSRLLANTKKQNSAVPNNEPPRSRPIRLFAFNTVPTLLSL